MSVSVPTPCFIRPTDSAIHLDHTGHWLTDSDRARTALVELGFIVTPFSEQRVPGPDGEMISAGTGNQCVMLEQGYLEFLTPLADTPTGLELKRGISRYQGMHIAAFEVADAHQWHAHCASAGFEQSPVVDLRRFVSAPTDEKVEARFSVARSKPPGMPEGRFQALVHHTPEALWQSRYMRHPNTALGLLGLVVLVDDLGEASRRYAKWFGAEPTRAGDLAWFSLQRGDVLMGTLDAVSRIVPVDHGATQPGIAAAIISAEDPTWFERSDVRTQVQGPAVWLDLGGALGGALGVVATGTCFESLLGSA